MAKKNGVKKGKKRPDGVPEGAALFPREVPVALTEEEVNKKARKLAALQDDVDDLKEQLKAQGSALRDDIKTKAAELRALGKDIAHGTEDRKVQCYEDLDFARGVVRVVRSDTHEEVEQRVMTAEERQETFPGVASGKAFRGVKRPAPEDEVGVPEDEDPPQDAA